MVKKVIDIQRVNAHHLKNNLKFWRDSIVY
jgi:hypothetical protein